MKRLWILFGIQKKQLAAPVVTPTPVVEVVEPPKLITFNIKARESMCGYYSAYIYNIGKSNNHIGKYIVKIESRHETFYTYVTKEEIFNFCRNDQKRLDSFQNPKIGAPVDIEHSIIKTHISANEMAAGLRGLDFNLGQYYPRK